MEKYITATMLYDWVQCPHRVSLDLFGDQSQRDEISPFVKLLWEKGTLFEKEVVEKKNEGRCFETWNFTI